MDNPFLTMLWRAASGAMPYLVFLAVFAHRAEVAGSQVHAEAARQVAGAGEAIGSPVLPFQPKRHAVPDRAMDAADQLRAVMRADFKPQALLNKSEARLFKVLDKLVHKTSPLCFRADRTYRSRKNGKSLVVERLATERELVTYFAAIKSG